MQPRQCCWDRGEKKGGQVADTHGVYSGSFFDTFVPLVSLLAISEYLFFCHYHCFSLAKLGGKKSNGFLALSVFNHLVSCTHIICLFMSGKTTALQHFQSLGQELDENIPQSAPAAHAPCCSWQWCLVAISFRYIPFPIIQAAQMSCCWKWGWTPTGAGRMEEGLPKSQAGRC